MTGSEPPPGQDGYGRAPTAGLPADPQQTAADVAQPGLTVSAVARRLGVAPATLRTWDRRYGLGPTGHAAGSHRRYAPADLARLEEMRRLVTEGVTAAEAARLVRSGGAPGPPSAGGARPHPGGGRVVALGSSGPAAHGLARAALALDATTASRLIRSSIERRGVVPTWQDLLVPVLVGVGERWATTGTGVDAEHLLSECAIGVLRSVADRLDSPGNTRDVLLACAEEEQHSLPLYALAAAAAERRVGSRVLGARLPRVALADAVVRTGPPAVFLWSQIGSTGDPSQVAEIPRTRPAPSVMAAGPGWGWRGAPSPSGVATADDLAEAVAWLVHAAGC